ncbi:MAG: hypothetical protein CMM48_03765 [Rhodospirillaceae bacterium]|nr:hypothetical protein [Rhodospirillaceae bacterium]
MRSAILALFLLFGFTISAQAGEADVVKVRTAKERGGYTFIVSVRHGDRGWKHYADRWEVLSPNGKKIIAVRKLLHPHVNEQPFTRRLSGVKIPRRYKSVLVRAHDSVHGYGGRVVRVKIR